MRIGAVNLFTTTGEIATHPARIWPGQRDKYAQTKLLIVWTSGPPPPPPPRVQLLLLFYPLVFENETKYPYCYFSY